MVALLVGDYDDIVINLAGANKVKVNRFQRAQNWIFSLLDYKFLFVFVYFS